MRTRTRTGIWDRKYGWTSYNFPSTYASYLSGTTRWYPDWTPLADHCVSTANVSTASEATYGSSETITDAGGSAIQDDAGTYQWNPVDHTRQSCGCSPYKAVSVRSGTRRVEGGRYIPPPISSLPAVPQLTAAQRLSLYAECYNSMLPTFESDLSLANFIMELRDFKGLVKHLAHGKEAISLIAGDVTHWVEPGTRPRKRRSESLSAYRHRLKEWSKNRGFYIQDRLVDLDLTYSYAVRPFVQDVAAMSVMFGGLTEAIRKLNHQGSVRNVHHAVRTMNHIGTVSGSGQARTVTCTKNVYRLTAEMTYGLRPMSKLDAFMAWSGLRMDAKKLWDALPFTMVLDHYCNIGEALGSFDRSEVEVDMTRLLESVSSESAVATCFHPTYQTYSHFSGGGAGEASDLIGSTSYANYLPVSWRRSRSYKRYLVDVPYVRPPVLPRLQIPTCGQIRKDLDLVYSIFYRGKSPDLSWRSE